MQNIPPIRQIQTSAIRQLRRGNKAMPSEAVAGSSPVKRHLERRHRHERRQKQIKVSLERRNQGLLRRKIGSISILAAESDILSDTVGKHINTSA